MPRSSTIGRALLGLCFLLDGMWWLATWDQRAAYLQSAGAPAFLIPPIALVYVGSGALLVVGRSVRTAILPLMAVAGAIAVLLHTDLGPGGIGEYPLERHGTINAQALLGQVALVGCLLLAFAAPNAGTPIDLRALELGRILLGGFFVADALWLAHDYDATSDAWSLAGAGPGWPPVVLAAQIVCGMALAAGRAMRGSAIALIAALAARIGWLHTDLTGTGPAPASTHIHLWFVYGSLLAGCLIVADVGPITLLRRASLDGHDRLDPPAPRG